MDFQGRTICITGASRGIGYALCEAFARRGAATLIAAGRSRGELPDRMGQARIAFVEVDLSDAAGPGRLAQAIMERHGDCSVLVNNAGTQEIVDCVAPDAGEAADRIAREIQLNFITPVTLGLHLMPVLLRHPEAAICNITSGLALAPKQSAPVYCATKAGLSSHTRALRYQAQARAPNVKVFEALPPLVDTDMTRGRGSGKLSPEACAEQIVEGMRRDRPVIDVGKTRLLRAVLRLSPALGYKILREG
jgi:uncharacterized oxidoreductase